MMNKKLFLDTLSCFLLGATSVLPIYAQHITGPSVDRPSAGSTNDVDDTDVDLLNYPIPVKYAHGLDIPSPVDHRLPAPKDPVARQRYSQAQDLRDKGLAYLAYRRYGKAIIRLNQSQALWPDSAQTYRWLAEAYEADGQTKQAITNYRLLFYGWPGRIRSDVPEKSADKVPADKARDYDQTTAAETDPTLLMRFSLLLQQTGQYEEAEPAYERGMQMLAVKYPADILPPLSASGFTTRSSLEAATLTALAINEASYQDKKEAEDQLAQALSLDPASSIAQFHLTRIQK